MYPSSADRPACIASAAGRTPLRRGLDAGHRRPHGAADQAIEPVVVELGRLGPPLVDRPGLARGDDVGFRVGDVLDKEPVLLGLLAKERQRPVVAGDSGKPGVDERLPRVSVKGDVPDSLDRETLGMYQLQPWRSPGRRA